MSQKNSRGWPYKGRGSQGRPHRRAIFRFVSLASAAGTPYVAAVGIGILSANAGGFRQDNRMNRMKILHPVNHVILSKAEMYRPYRMVYWANCTRQRRVAAGFKS